MDFPSLHTFFSPKCLGYSISLISYVNFRISFSISKTIMLGMYPSAHGSTIYNGRDVETT